MSSRKRSYDALDDDDGVTIESASSSLRQNSQKRPRAVLAAERGGSTVSDEDDDDIPDSISRLNSILPPEPTHSDDEDEDPEVDELRGTQFVERQMRKSRVNVEMDHGIIEEIFCRNFMCHTKLRIKLGPLINFIIGHNGSGKSAVMTALTMCLGGKAASTNRGSSLKSMIKEGQDTATLAVKIKNQGDGAFRPDVYGQSITVERHFSRSGTSGFKIKNAQDRIVSTKKRDLDDIIDYFGLQLDNPINVLNQDMARQFLSNSSASDKYKFFIRGTQLEQLDSDYKLLEESLDALETRLSNRVDDIKILEGTAKEAEDRKKRLAASDSIRVEVQKTQRMHAWAQVEEQEHILEHHQRMVSHAETALKEAEEKAETAAESFTAREQAHVEAQARAAELQNALEPSTEKLNAAQRELSAGKERLMEMQATTRNAKVDYNSEKTKRTKLEDEIRTERELLDDANGAEHTERLERLDRLEADREVAKNDRDAHEGGLHSLEDARASADEAFKAATPPVDYQRQEVKKAEDMLKTLQTNSNRRFAGYKRNTDRVVDMINRETRWRSKPVGPIGHYIKLKKPQWTNIIERTLNNTLDSFVVICREDQVLLTDIMRRAEYQPSVIVGDASRLDTTGKEPSDDLDTILRVLDISNDLVRNQLIINVAVEQIVLIPDRQRGIDYLNSHANGRPPNVKAVLTFNDDRSAGGIRLDFSRGGAMKFGPVYPWNGPSRMQISREEQIASQNQVIAAAKRELDRFEQAHRQARQQLESARQAVERYKRTRIEKTKIVQQITDDIDKLKEEIESNQPHDGRLQELERQLTAAREAEASQKSIVEDLVRQKAVIDEAQRETKDRLDSISDEVAGHEQRIEDANTESRTLAEKRMTALRQKNEAYASINDRKTELQRCNDEHDAQQKLLEESFLNEAEKICPRIPIEPGMTPAKLDERLERFRQELERAQQLAGGTLEELTLSWKEAHASHRRALKDFKHLKVLSRQLKYSLSERRNRWKKFRQFITYRARSNFSFLLSERNFRGRVLLDHNDKLLDLAVEPDLTRQSDAGREARTLSGGEKSFSTICLLLSIWEAMGSPIRCLDEFDVFMDSANRSMSMTMMIQAARRAVGRQFILITPQSMQDVELGDDVRIHRMSDPERGQQALPFTQS